MVGIESWLITSTNYEGELKYRVGS
uniref:Uncharacterized protein n=1 Tax=Arundo donax TaxID=35708 RepID=A0A0A8YRZ5_ARUDO